MDTSARDGAALAETMAVAARKLSRNYAGLDDALRGIVTNALDVIPGAVHVGVNLALPDGTVESRAPSDDVVRELDRLQSELREGPCVDSIWSHERTRVPDMVAHQQTWPRFAPAAIALGVRALMSFQLFKHGPSAALNIYADTANAFDDHALDIAALFAAQAALVLQGAEQADGLRAALASRDTIGQAKGILMERFGLDEDQAFARLVKSSQDTNIKLHDVARWLIAETAERAIPPPAPGNQQSGS